MNREILERPFGPEQIKQREGNFGKMLDYIEGHAVIQRLNDAFEGDWSFSILQHDVLKDSDEVIVLGELKAGDTVKSQFGSSRITHNSQSGGMVSLADDFKAAATDALKKCATLLGVGLHLYGGNNGQTHRAGSYQGKPSNAGGNRNGGNGGNGSGPQAGNGNGGGNGSGTGNGNGRLTAKQYRYIVKLAEDQGSTKADLDKQSVEMFGTVAQYLSKADASAMIEHLLGR
jgi:hypothetical protein